MTEPFRMHEITVGGGPRERGHVHGEAIRPIIQECIREFGDRISEAMGFRVEPYYRRMMTDGRFLQTALAWTPHLVEEARAIGEGANVDFETIMAWQCMQEIGWFALDSKGLDVPVFSCTALGSAPKDGPTILAQTADNPSFVFGRQVMLHLTDPVTGIHSHILTFPGIIGVYGLNDHGIGVCINAMVHAMSHRDDGLGAPFVARGVMAQPTFLDAERFVTSVPHASGNNFTVGGPGRVVAFEASASKVEPYTPPGGQEISYHTNHPLANDDQVPFDAPEGLASSTTRFEVAKRRVDALSRPMHWEDARDILSSHDVEDSPICNHLTDPTRSVTCFGIVMELSPRPLLHLSSGPPCCSEFRDFGFDA